MCVPVRRHHLKDAAIDGQDADIKSTTTQIKDENVLLPLLLVETVCDGGSCWLVDDASHIQTGDDTGILGRLALCIIEISCSQEERVSTSDSSAE